MKARESCADREASIGAILSWSPPRESVVVSSHPDIDRSIHTLIDPSPHHPAAACSEQDTKDRRSQRHRIRSPNTPCGSIASLPAHSSPSPHTLDSNSTSSRTLVTRLPLGSSAMVLVVSRRASTNCEIDDCLQPPLPRTEVRRPRFKDLKVPCRTCHKHHKR